MLEKKGRFQKAPNRQKKSDCKTVWFNDAETEESMTWRRCLEKKKQKKNRAPEVDVTIAESVQKSMKTEFGGLECLSIKKDWRPRESF